MSCHIVKLEIESLPQTPWALFSITKFIIIINIFFLQGTARNMGSTSGPTGAANEKAAKVQILCSL